MHEVRKELKSTAQMPEDVLPKVILDAVVGAEFWRELDDVPLTNETVDDKPEKKTSFFGEVIDQEDTRFI
jgi:hypothetical protein